MNHQTIFWRKDQVEILDRMVTIEDFKTSSMFKYLYCPCVWKSQRIYIFGNFEQSERFNVYWKPRNPKQWDEDFRTSLMLLDIPINN